MKSIGGSEFAALLLKSMVVRKFTPADRASAETAMFCFQLWLQTAVVCVFFIVPWMESLTPLGWVWTDLELSWPRRVHRDGDPQSSHSGRSWVHQPCKIPSILFCHPADKLIKNVQTFVFFPSPTWLVAVFSSFLRGALMLSWLQ